MTHKDWQKKHYEEKEHQRKKGVEKGLDNGYLNPEPVGFKTFN